MILRRRVWQVPRCWYCQQGFGRVHKLACYRKHAKRRPTVERIHLPKTP